MRGCRLAITSMFALLLGCGARTAPVGDHGETGRELPSWCEESVVARVGSTAFPTDAVYYRLGAITYPPRFEGTPESEPERPKAQRYRLTVGLANHEVTCTDTGTTYATMLRISGIVVSTAHQEVTIAVQTNSGRTRLVGSGELVLTAIPELWELGGSSEAPVALHGCVRGEFFDPPVTAAEKVAGTVVGRFEASHCEHLLAEQLFGAGESSNPSVPGRAILR